MSASIQGSRPNAIPHPLHFSFVEFLSSVFFSSSLLILYSYFGLILFLFTKVVKAAIFRPHRYREDGSKISMASENVFWLLLAIMGFGFTWFSESMISYLNLSYQDFLSSCELTGKAVAPYPHCSSSSQNYSFFSKCNGAVLITQFSRLSQWLDETYLFRLAWDKVVSTPRSWWWSFEVCAITTGSYGLFLRNEGKRLSISNVWLFMLLGQAVAMSVSQSLFFLAMSLRPLIKGNLEQLALLKCESEGLLYLGDTDEDLAENGIDRSNSDPASSGSVREGLSSSRSSSSPNSSRSFSFKSTSSSSMPPPRFPSSYSSNSALRSTSVKRVVSTSKGIKSEIETKKVTQHMILGIESRFSRVCVHFFIILGTVVTSLLPTATSFLPTAVIHLASLLIFLPTSVFESFEVQFQKFYSIIVPPVVREWIFNNILAFVPPGDNYSFSSLHKLIAALNLINKLFNTWQVLKFNSLTDTPSILFKTFFSHPAQTSISYDNIFLTLGVIAFMGFDSRRRSEIVSVPSLSKGMGSVQVLGLSALAVSAGPSITLSVYLARREAIFEKNLLASETEAVGALLGSDFEKDRKRGKELKKQIEDGKSRKWVVTVQREVKTESRRDGNVLKKRE